MKKTGNTLSNSAFNPRGVKPAIPSDPDMIDNAIEKHIRAKYQHRTLGVPAPPKPMRHDTGSTASSEERPPVPPKPYPPFAPTLRAASSMTAMPVVPTTVRTVNNAIGSGSSTPASARPTELSPASTGSLPPRKPQSVQSQAHAPYNQIYTQPSQSLQNISPASAFNPFVAPFSGISTTSLPLDTSFQRLNIQDSPLAPPTLFPHNTGSWQSNASPAQNHNPFYASAPSSAYPHNQPIYTNTNPFQAAYQDPPQRNPFLRTSRSQNFASTNPYKDEYFSEPSPPVPAFPEWAQPQHTSHIGQGSAHPVFAQQPLQMQSQQQPDLYFAQSQTWPQNGQNPQVQQAQSHVPDYQAQSQTVYSRQRLDKHSILALYNSPNPTRRDPTPIDTQPRRSVTMPIIASNVSTPPMTSPASVGTKNPFAARSTANTLGHIEERSEWDNRGRDSLLFSAASGRHSPDAFASLSSRFG